jgi:DNA polymerase-3 subunit alpha
MSSDFVHLHVHTDYSMLDGACRISDLAKQVQEWGMPAVACTDHGSMAGAVEFYQTVREHGVKPIIGCECYVAPGDRRHRDPQSPHSQGFHLVLLATDFTGYQNLCRLNSAAHIEGYYYKPRIDRELLAAHADGLVALTACVGGVISARLLENNDADALQTLKTYLDIFGRDRLYLELQDHGMKEEVQVNRRLIELADEYGVGLVATNDAHYLKREHAKAHEVLLCIGTQSTLDDPRRLRFSGPEFYLKSADEMKALFSERPDAIRNTLAIAERCNLTLKLNEPGENHYPVYEVPEAQSREEYLRSICLEGIRERYHFDPATASLDDRQQEIMRRLDYELEIIAKTGFTSYFLVVWDFIRFARERGIPVGPGRGSGAGSIVAYLTRITDMEPLRYGLLFERFLNPDRVSPPDFDIDLCERRRQEVIAYVRDKYGHGNVAQIGTFGTLKTKAVLKDVARVMGRAFAEGNQLTKLVPADPKMTLERALKESPELVEFRDRESWVQEAMEYAEVLEGLNRNMSTHAAGVIIGDQKLDNLVPLAKGGNEEIITQYSAGPCEELGLLKMDFLGLRTLTIIQDTLDMIRDNRGTELKAEDIPLDDKAAFDLLNKGNTIAVFQLESSGMRDLCRRFGVQRIEDIIALIALYRPGPMQFLDEFIARKTGQTPIDYDMPEMQPILEETYGIMLYQEQVMQVVQKVAGFSLGQADILRRAMGKKKVKVMEEQYEKFIQGCTDNGIKEQVAMAIWDKIVKFAGYGFNKSHSAAYAILSYRTAYLKANYPVEFMAAVLSSELGNSDKLAFFLRECKEMSIPVKPPSVNSSGLNFAVDGDSICFGLGPIKGVGSAAAAEIISARRKEGPFEDLLSFCERTGQQVNRRVMENLCKAGAFDCFGLRRSQVFALTDEALDRAQQAVADRAAGQGSLFDMLDSPADNPLNLTPPDIPEWEPRELLRYEKELLGFYVTGHPLSEDAEILAAFQLHSVGSLSELPAETVTRTGGIISKLDVKRSKRDNRPWAIIELEGFDGSFECLVFADAYERHAEQLVPEHPILVEGYLNAREEERTSLVVERVLPMGTAPEHLTEEVHIRLHQASTRPEDLQQLQQICSVHAGETPLVLCLICAGGEIAFVRPDAGVKIRNSSDFRHAVRDLLGEECLLQKPQRKLDIQPRKSNWNRRGSEAGGNGHAAA